MSASYLSANQMLRSKPQVREMQCRSASFSTSGAASADPPRKRRCRSAATAREENGVLSLADDEVVYRPQTKETRAAYEAMLSVIQQQFGGQPMDVLGGAADVVLAILKNDKINARRRRSSSSRGRLGRPLPAWGFRDYRPARAHGS